MTCSGGVGKTSFLSQWLPFPAGAEVAKDGVGLLRFGSGRMRRGDVTSGNEEVFPSVIVEIIESGAEASHAQALRPETARRCDFNEVSLAGVLKQRKCLLVERNIGDAGKAVVVEVAEVEAHAGDECTLLRQGGVGLESDFFKFVSEVVEEEVVLRVVGDKEVGFAIEIVIGDAYAHALADMIADTPFL